MTQLVPITPPAVEPITVAELRAFARIDPAITSEDSMLPIWIGAAREQIEAECGRRLITQTLDMVLDAFPATGESIRLHPDLWQPQSVALISYLDAAGIVQTIDAADYVLDATTSPGFVFPAADYAWPTDVADSANAIRLRVVCGYGDAAADIPYSIRARVMIRANSLYENRGELTTLRTDALPDRFVDRLLDPHRSYSTG